MPGNPIARSGIQNHLRLFMPDGSVNVERTLELTGLSLDQAKSVFKVPLKSKEKELPQKLLLSLRELAGALEFVSETLGGSWKKTQFWLKTPNAEFGGLAPMDLILVRRYKIVYQFILAAKKNMVKESQARKGTRGGN